MLSMSVHRRWWIPLVRGVISILFGLAALLWPHITLLVLVLLFGVFVLLNGLFALIAAIEERSAATRWWIILLEGIVGIIIGVMTFLWPGLTAIALLYLIAAWAIVAGVFEIIAAFWFRNEISGEWLLALAGVISVIFGFLLVIRPLAGALALIWLIGIYAIVYGVILVIRGIQSRTVATA